MSFLGPIRTLLIAAVLWLPLMFFVWFAFRQGILTLVGWICSSLFGWWTPELFVDMQIVPGGTPGSLSQHEFIWHFNLPMDAQTIASSEQMGRPAAAELNHNPLVFGYSVPLFAGLVMATPLSGLKRIKQLLIGLPILLLFWCFGVFFDVLQILCFNAGDPGIAAVASMGFNREFVALFYQLGYLILPSISPVICWIAMNQRFIEALVTSDSDRVDDAGTPPTNGAAP